MLSSEMTATQKAMPAADPGLTMELLDGFTTGPDGFYAHVRAAVGAIDGALLFELPASGLVADS